MSYVDSFYNGTTGSVLIGHVIIILGSSNTTASNNTAVGYQSGYSNTTGVENTALGNRSLYTNTVGTGNVAVGHYALNENSTASHNTGVGYLALRRNTTGTSNVSLGYAALTSNTTASNNTAVGFEAAKNNTTGYNLVALGRRALLNNTTGTESTAVGWNALVSNTTGVGNTAVGLQTLDANTTGGYNNAFGYDALGVNTLGGENNAFGRNALGANTTANGNSAFGHRTLQANTTGGNNTAFGKEALKANTTASNNTAVGHHSLQNNVTGGYNTAIGEAAGANVTTSDNTFIGGDAGRYITSGAKNTVIGQYNGNQGGLDIRTSSYNIVLSDGDGNPRVVVNSSGSTKMVSTGGSPVAFGGHYHEIVHDNNDTAALILSEQHGSFASDVMQIRCARPQTSAYYFMTLYSSGTGDVEFGLRGDGNAYADNAWQGGGADYAEYFEWDDGNTANEDRRGYSVVLENSKMRKATADDDADLIFGVISARPSMIGDADIDAWKSKYLKDDFGAYQRNENDERILNPDYDPDQEYTSREDRPEWDTVGLMGKLRIRKGQPTGSNWIKMRDVSDTVEEWLVR